MLARKVSLVFAVFGPQHDLGVITTKRQRQKQKAVLLFITRRGPALDSQIDEVIALAKTACIDVVKVVRARRMTPNATYYVGVGKTEEIKAALTAWGADILLINRDISPRQEANLERVCVRPIISYTRLILEIFSSHARSHEGKLQVELAQMQYMATHIVRGWTHLERQRGGIGLRGGPGEKQLETDRRLLKRRIERTQFKLEKLKERRKLSMRRRQECELFSVAIVGYTNTGKSTLFKRLTGADVYCADKPFATLDPTIRRLRSEVRNVVISDTVGFITNLPHTLVEAFRATLTEICSADLLIHVADVSADDLERKDHEVEIVLNTLKVNRIPRIRVLNKIDVTGSAVGFARATAGYVTRVSLSAQTSDGVPLLKRALDEYARAQTYKLNKVQVQTPHVCGLDLPAYTGAIRAD